MIILHVTGDDYAAMTFEENYNVQEVYQTMVAEECTNLQLDAEGCYIEVKLLKFGSVDKEFFLFAKLNLIDYDAGKHENIYKVED